MQELEIPKNLEKHFNIHEHRAVERFDYKDYTVYISEGGPYYVKDSDNPLGFYEAAYTVQSGKSLFYQPLRFDILHDIDYSDGSRPKMRINTARKEAKKHIDTALELEYGQTV